MEGERNLLELIRKADIDLPTFCYHSELSVYGACRLCLVDVDGRGIMGACSTPPEPGLRVKTTTQEIREIRRIAVELLLANHDQQCPTCPRSANCQLQSLAQRLGIRKVRFKPVHEPVPLDESSPSLIRDPNKCVLCGDCVRVCSEIQGIGAIDFAHRGHDVMVKPAFGKQLGEVECVNCGQCASVCPTGALTPKPEVDQVWSLLADPTKNVVVQIAPAVRVGLGECFGLKPGEITTGRIVAALRHLGFDQVYDTSFAADLTVSEDTPHEKELEGASLDAVIPFSNLFRRVLDSGEDIISHDIRYDRSILNTNIFVIEPHTVLCGTFQDITEPIFQKEQIIERARDVIQKNLKTVQQIAYLLGENAAESEITLNSIVRSFSPEDMNGKGLK